VRITIALLFGLAIVLGRREGLPWTRAIAGGAVIIVLTTVIIWLESHVH
jgi:prepilin signal peptidase PulO-like enzyme (type II secretory pathway)